MHCPTTLVAGADFVGACNRVTRSHSRVRRPVSFLPETPAPARLSLPLSLEEDPPDEPDGERRRAAADERAALELVPLRLATRRACRV